MHKKLFELLKDKCQDMGLSEKAIQEIATAGSDGLTDESSDEDIATKVNLILPFPKAMQGEGTRWAQKIKEQKQTETDKLTKELEVLVEKKYGKRLEELEKENETLSKEKEFSTRKASIDQLISELKIPAVHAKRLHFPDDLSLDDVKKELTDYKQELITERLMTEDSTDTAETREAAMKEQGNASFDKYAVE